jgi:hypothetical protein
MVQGDGRQILLMFFPDASLVVFANGAFPFNFPLLEISSFGCQD